jgi:hypothetical protein
MGMWFGTLIAGMFVLGAIGILAPSAFGPTGSGRLGKGPSLIGLGALVVICGLVGLARRRYLRALYLRLREPFVRRMSYEAHFSGTAEALADCPGYLQSRWAMKWLYAPALLVVAGVTFAFSSAYFVVGTILSLGRVGWGTPVLAAANVLLSVVTFALAASRLTAWRLAVSVHRDVAGNYAD